ncbi:hypothetical protein [Paenibacillus polymyxa]|uniref:hypothetical protein n=1 Tax=Paenibacillus polymyxa TaxID=1406 RepID=UPI0003D353D2|nr:hypothetical protein [Paenibacillus polymyxa]AIW41801.1 hypothetical protein X809_38650 [Paenibacillus polymyxa CR1]
MSERIINLPDGLQPMSEEDLKTIWNKADDARGEEAHMSNDVFDLVNALDAAYAQIDSLQQQLAERDRTIDLLTKQITDEVGISAKAIAERDMFKTSFEHWNKEAHRVVDEKNKLRKGLKSAEILLSSMPMDNEKIWTAYTKIKEALGE